MNKERIKEVLETIIEDTAKDAENLDGKPFTGKIVAEQFGYQGAQIQALAKIIKEIL